MERVLEAYDSVETLVISQDIFVVRSRYQTEILINVEFATKVDEAALTTLALD